MQSNILPFFLPIYGITVMSSLLGVNRSNFTKRKVIILFIFCCLVLTINISVFTFFGREVYSKLYFLWVQLPLYISFSIISQYKGIKLLFTLLTTITLASIPVLITILLRIFTHSNLFIAIVGCIFSYIIALVFINKFMRPNYIYILQHGEDKIFWKFSVIPMLYYLYSYSISGYNFTANITLDSFFIRRIPDMIVFISYILLVDIFKNVHEKQTLTNERTLLAMQIDTAAKQIDVLKTTQKQTSIYRHDMRHHIALIHSYLIEDNVEKARQYLDLVQSNIDSITPISYCENNLVNLILTSFVSKANEHNITLTIDVILPKTLSIPETELCTLLSNALENAVNATSKLENDFYKKIYINCKLNDNRLLLYIENCFNGHITLENNIPVSNQNGHGLGVKSIESIVTKRDGYFACEIIDQTFILRIVLPT